MIHIGIDPGVRMCGVAIEGNGLYLAHRVQSHAATLVDRATAMAFAVVEDSMMHWRGQQACVCVEGQQFYGTANSKGDPNQLIDLATVTGIMMGVLATHLQVVHMWVPLPRQWKGSVPKEIHHERLKERHPHWIAPVERDTPDKQRHHVWDAVGLLEKHKERIG